jgi:CheY-like chemotaxis protein
MNAPHDPLPFALLCDDSPLVRLTVARRLRAEGLRVVERASAADAIAPPTDPDPPACALLDVDLGDADGTDGIDVARALRVRHPQLPVAFFTGTTTPAARARAAELGPVFRKPDDLDAAVAWVVAHARP